MHLQGHWSKFYFINQLNLANYNIDYNLFLLRSKVPTNQGFKRLDLQISFNHSDCVNLELIDGSDKEILIFHGDGYPNLVDADNIRLHDSSISRTLFNVQAPKSRDTQYLTVYYDIINFVGLIARNNRQVMIIIYIDHLHFISCLLCSTLVIANEKIREKG